MQISWIIYNKNGEEIKAEDHYINDDFKIENASYKIHGIDHKYLEAHGEQRVDVMKLLANDITEYQPMLIGHFMELDIHMISADFYRADIRNPALGLPTFCTMKNTGDYALMPGRKYLRLNELYTILFDRVQPGQHNAISDARADAECFFELVRKGKINDQLIDELQEPVRDIPERKKIMPYLIVSIALSIIAITTLIIYLLWTR